MKICKLCGLENPEEARFCMKCGCDMDAVKSGESFFDVPQSDSFTPQGSPGDPRSILAQKPPISVASGRSESDVDDIMAYEYARAAEMELAEYEPEEEPPDVQPVEPAEPGPGSGPGERNVTCRSCGVINSREQRYCRNCGASLPASRPARTDGSEGGESGWDLDGIYDSLEAEGERPAYDEGGGYAGGEPEVPLAREEPQVPLIETSLLAPVSPSSDYYSSDIVKSKRKKARGRVEWRAHDLAILIGLAILLFAGIWFFFLGGVEIFSGKVRNLTKAGDTMSGLKSFEYTISGSMESVQAGDFGGSGTVRYESPGRSLWQFITTIPGSPPKVTQQSEVDGRQYVDDGSGWKTAKSEDANADVNALWSDFSSLEDLGQEPVGGVQCLHYKYRISPETLTGMLGVWNSEGASDAVVEAWVDPSSHRIVKLTTQIYNVQLVGMRTTVSLDFSLSAVDQPYDIKALI